VHPAFSIANDIAEHIDERGGDVGFVVILSKIHDGGGIEGESHIRRSSCDASAMGKHDHAIDVDSHPNLRFWPGKLSAVAIGAAPPDIRDCPG
jgi:hypothetical protein